MSRHTILSFSLASLLALSHCGKSDSDSSADDVLVSTLELESADAVVDGAQVALQSTAFGATDVVAGSLETGLIVDDNETAQSENDPYCSEHGEPWDEDNNSVMQSGEDYNGLFFYCAVASKTIESSDTIPGALA